MKRTMISPSDPQISQDAGIFAWIIIAFNNIFLSNGAATSLAEMAQISEIISYGAATLVAIGALWINWDRYVAAWKRRFRKEKEEE